MESVDRDYELMEDGVKALLGKKEYPPAEKMPPPCVHISDGFVYDDTAVFVTLQCVKCNLQYDVLKATGMIM